MATSGSYDFNLTRDGICKGAIRIVKGMGGKVGGSNNHKNAQAEIAEAAEALNMMLKQWEAEGMGLWLNKELYIFLAKNTGQYSLGPSGDHATLTMIETELSSSAAASAGSIEVDSITGISDADAIGIELDDDTLHWTTVNGSPSGTTITLTTALASVAAENNNVYTYTTKAQRPLNILEATLYQDDASEIPLNIYNRDEWRNITTKETNSSTPTCIYYDPQLTNGLLNVWQRPSKTYNYIKATVKYPIEDFDAAANDPDFPPELHRAVKFNLAVDIALEYEGIDLNKFLTVERKAAELYNSIYINDAWNGSIFFKAND